VRSDVRDAVLRGVSGAAETHDAFQLRDEHEDGLRAIDVFGVINELEIPLTFMPLDKLLGACVRVDSSTVGILITTERDLHMQRFTAAHELGHFVLEHEGSLDREVRYPGDTKDRELPEVEADAFAAEFLMPKWLVRGVAERRQWWSAESLRDPSVVYQMSLRLGLSYKATCWGLVSNEYVSYSVAERLVARSPKEMKTAALHGTALGDPWADVWVLGEGDDGSFLHAGPNDRFVVEVEEKAAGGFRWNMEHAIDAGFELLDDESVTSGPRVGGASRRRLVFGAPRPGLHELRLHHRRSFAKDGGILGAIRISVSTVGASKGGGDALPLFPSVH
jgi:Zn-dependent peptidase ImmA (M78 family)